MRTRFHTPDFSNNPTPSFFHLLPPPPPPTSPSNLVFQPLLHADPLLTDLAIPTLPIHAALSRFYSDVLPQLLHHPPITLLMDQTSIVGEDMGINIAHTFENEVIESGVEQKTLLNIVCDYNEPKLDIIQFEVPQPDTIVVTANIFEEMVENLPEVSEKDVKLDETNCELRRPYRAQKSVYSVDSILSDYYPHEETCASENEGYLKHHLHHCAFPHFEVDDITLENSVRPVVGYELVSFVCFMEVEYQNQGGHISSDIKELLPLVGTSLVDTIQIIEHENFGMDITDLFMEKDFICMKENQFSQEQSACSMKKLDGYYYMSVEPIFFLENQFSDINTSAYIDIFLDYNNADKPLNLCSLVKENMSFLTFDELIVSNEIVLADDVFKSLPVPIILEHAAVILMQDTIWKILVELKPQPLSVSNDIYLDWHLLEDHKLNNDNSGVCEKLLEDLNHHHNKLELIPCDKDMPILNMISEDSATDSVGEEYKLTLKFVSGSCYISHGNIPKVDVDKGLPRIPISDSGLLLQSKCTDMEALLTKSVPVFNDLEFFLNPQESSFVTKRASRVEHLDSSVSGHTDNLTDYMVDRIPVKRFHNRDVRIHPVPLSDNILTLINYFQKCYLAILESMTLIHATHTSFSLVDKSKLLRLSKQELVNEIGVLIAQSTSSRDENIMALLTLCAIKQMSWYLCFYGIHASHSYVCNLCCALDFLRLRLCFLQSLISDAVSQTDEDVAKSHPSLAKISEILNTKSSKSESKILIVIDEVLWCPLRILLTSIGLSFKEIQNHQCPSYHQDSIGTSDSSKVVTDILLDADCMIATHKSISGIFPFHNFALILEYGGSHFSSRISCLPQTSAGLPPLNFLKLTLEHLEELKIFCESSELPFSLGAALDGHATSLLQTHGIQNLQKLEQVLNFVPGSGKAALVPSRSKIAEARTVSSSTSLEAKSAQHCTIPSQSSHLLFKNVVKQNHTGLSYCPEQLIVMNTQNLNKEMIVSRRSTYQRLLALEKDGVQVVERDSNLPVDIILTASICLVWYEGRNLINKVNQTEASSCLSFCIEYIATNVLTQLSFAFCGCYLVFEGDHNFTSSISENSDGLYAAAASLGIDIQLLYSHSSESTCEIILNCIRSATRFTKNLYPTMPESETVAECFLTKFPSMNPLSAHAMLCSVNSLSEFFQMSLELRLQALKKYYVPEVSINLLSVLCKFGEREDARSGTTDCSSSVSSAPESEYIQCKLGLGGMKRKSSCSPPKDRTIVDNSLQYEPANTPSDASLNPPRVPEKFVSRMSVDTKESTDFAKPSSCLDNRFFGTRGKGKYISMDELCGDKFMSAYTPDQSVGEIDFNESFDLDKNFYPFDKSRASSPSYEKRRAPESKNPRITRRLSFDAIGDSIFSTTSKINVNLCRGENARDYEYEGTETSDIFHFSDIGSHDTLSKVGRDDSEGGAQPNAKRFNIPAYGEADISCYGGTPFRNAIDSYKLQQGSPWTTEFLNRVREKSMAHQKSLSCSTCPPNFRNRGNKHDTTKRKSPSIIDFYRYQGGSSVQKFTGRKKRLQEKEPSSSTEREDSSGSRTPLDKRARKALSYTTSKHGSQSKLVWLDGSI